MTVEITAEEKAMLLWALICAQVDNEQYLKNFPDSHLSDELRTEIEKEKALFDKLNNLL